MNTKTKAQHTKGAMKAAKAIEYDALASMRQEDRIDAMASHIDRETAKSNLSIARGLVALRRPCERCDESGKEPGNPLDACHDCGGLGEHCDAAELLTEARAAIARAQD